MRYFISLTTLLALLWLGLSGVYKPLILVLGGLSVALVVWLTERMEVLGAEHDPASFSWRLPSYWLWLVGQIILANWSVARVVLNPQRVRPIQLCVPITQHSAVGKVTYANSITLTPGTITTRLQPGTSYLEVHALTAATADDLCAGEMAKRVNRLEGPR